MNRFIVNASLLLSILSVPNILAQSSGSSDEDLESVRLKTYSRIVAFTPARVVIFCHPRDCFVKSNVADRRSVK